MKTKWLNRTLVTGPYLCLCLSEAEYHKALDYLGIEKDDRNEWLRACSHARVHEITNKNSGPAFVVCFRPNKEFTAAQNYSALAHEAVHVWQMFCEHIGEEKPSMEFEAYSIQGIFQTLLEEYLSRKKRKRP